MSKKQHEFKRLTFPGLVTKVDEAAGLVAATVNVLGIIDEGEDIVEKGAFTKTIQENFGKIRVLDSHQTRSVIHAVGKPIKLAEIGRNDLPDQLKQDYPMATGGLYTETQFMLDDPTSLAVFKRLKEGYVTEWSIGFEIIISEYRKVKNAEGKDQVVRVIKEARLLEYSCVLWGMNQATYTEAVKQDDPQPDEIHKAVPMQDLPLADRNRVWDAGAADGRVRAWAGGDMLDWAKYRKAFFWYDAEDAEKLGSYKLGYADVLDGKLTAIPRGIFAVAAVLQGGRGGVDIPEADQAAIKKTVGKWYKKMAAEFEDESLVAPWDKGADETDTEHKEMTPDGAMARLGDWFKAKVYDAFMCNCNALMSGGYINGEEHRALCQAGMRMLDMIDGAMSEDMALRPIMMLFSEGEWLLFSRGQKAGRTISAATGDKLQAALDSVYTGCELIEELLTAEGILGNDEEDTSEEMSHTHAESGNQPLTETDYSLEIELLEAELAMEME